MHIYPWGETTPNQLIDNLPDEVNFNDRALVFRENGRPSYDNATSHDWAAVVGSALTPFYQRTGTDFRGPQSRPVICPRSGPGTTKPPKRCDDTAYGKGAGGRLVYDIEVAGNAECTVWFAVGGSDQGPTAARAEQAAALADPAGALKRKISDRLALSRNTRLQLPGDPLLAEGIEWSKQNLADMVQDVRDLQLRPVNQGHEYPAPASHLPRARFIGAGWPDHPWLFATDGEYTAFASVAAGQFDAIKDHLRALRDASRKINGDSGKVVREVITDGSVYFGTLADKGNTDETAKFPSAVALVWRWTGDDGFLDEMYDFAKANMRYIARARTPTTTCGRKGWAPRSSAAAWARRRSSTTRHTRSAASAIWPRSRAPGRTRSRSNGPKPAPPQCKRASTVARGCRRSPSTRTRSAIRATARSSSATGSA